MSGNWTRPSVKHLTEAYDRLFRSNTPLSKLKDAAFGGRLFSLQENGEGVAGRSMAWKLFLIEVAPLTPPAAKTPAKPPIDALQRLRAEYRNFLLDKMRAPDGSYEHGLSVPGVEYLPRPTDEGANLQKNNPLSLDEDSPWKDWHAAVDLRRTIRQDVERTFPEVEYFRDPDVQAQLTLILYIESVTHPDIGYRQGMHELLAPIYFAVDHDSIASDATADVHLSDFCTREWVAADAWALFRVVMDGVYDWYEWREPTPATLPSPLRSQFRYSASEGHAGIQPYLAPIVLTCQRLQAELLRNSDPLLWQAMQKAGIEPQIYGIRWLRLLFTREFSLSDAMIIWDSLFASESPFELVLWVCVAMLIRIRNQLIPADYSGQITYLLRYPPPPPRVDSTTPHHANILMRQAFVLLTTPGPATGASIMMENRNLLNIPIEVPEPVVSPRRGVKPIKPRRTSSVDMLRIYPGSSNDTTRSSKTRHPEQSQSVQLGLPELIARGLLEKGESLGINRTVMNAVSELRRNLPDLTNSLIRAPNTDESPYSSFPLVIERVSEDRSSWEQPSRFDMEKEIADLRSFQKRLGEAVGVAVDALLQDEGGRDDEAVSKIRVRKREAIESLAYARDLLNNGSRTDIDEERLFGEEEYRRRKAAQECKDNAEKQVSGRLRNSNGTPQLRPPEPAASIFIIPRERSSAQSPPAHPMSSLPRSPPTQRSTADIATRVHAATLPRMQSPSSTRHSSPQAAPWNYTRSNFTTPVLNSSSMPRPPPRTSTSLRPATNVSPPSSSGPVPGLPVSVKQDEGTEPPSRRRFSPDPLGALP